MTLPKNDDLQTILDNLPFIIARFDRELRHLYVNAAVECATGRPAQQSIGKTNRELGMPAPLCDRWDAEMHAVFASAQPREAEFEFPTPEGVRVFHARLVPEYGPDGTVTSLLSTTQDINDLLERQRRVEAQLQAEQKRYDAQLQATNEWLEEANEYLTQQTEALTLANARLEELATTDGLTGLKNHRAFQERLHDELARGARYYIPLSLLLLDVDHFKAYNDTFGHPAGDQVLKILATILLETLRETDFVARYGGEEFAILLLNTDRQTAMVVAERVRRAVATHEFFGRNVTMSIGVAVLEDYADTPDQLLDRADIALYMSKSAGRDRVTCFTMHSH